MNYEVSDGDYSLVDSGYYDVAPKRVHESGECPYNWDECDGIGEYVPDPYSLEISNLYLYDYRCMGERIYSSDEI